MNPPKLSCSALDSSDPCRQPPPQQKKNERKKKRANVSQTHEGGGSRDVCVTYVIGDGEGGVLAGERRIDHVGRQLALLYRVKYTRVRCVSCAV